MTHPVLGWRILAPLLGETPAALNIVRSHHERYDGRGVPDGLKGDEIPLEARIVCAADALDAMTSDRAYRPTEMSLEMAMDELQAMCRNPVRSGRRRRAPRVGGAGRAAIGPEGRQPGDRGRRLEYS